MTISLSPTPRQLFLNPSTGAPASGFKLFTYQAGTTTKQATYVDSTGNTPNTNPIILDTLGECDLWLLAGTPYKLVFSPPTDTDPPTNAIWTRDNITASGGGFGGPIKTVTANYSIVVTDGTILVNAASAPINITLPVASACVGQIFNIKKIDGSANAVTIMGTVDGVTNSVISFKNQNSEVQSDGTTFWNL